MGLHLVNAKIQARNLGLATYNRLAARFTQISHGSTESSI